MTTLYLYDNDGFFAGTCSGLGAHPNSTEIAPPMGGGDGRARFVSGAWMVTGASSTLPLLTPMTLYVAFTPAERIAIKASTDTMVMEFWAMYQLSVQLDKPTDPNLVSVQEAIAYLARKPTDTPPGPGIIQPARVQQILAGIPQ